MSNAPALSEADLEQAFPWVPWREPLSVVRIDAPGEQHYACRICAALHGLSGRDVPSLPADPEVIAEHIRRLHSPGEAVTRIDKPIDDIIRSALAGPGDDAEKVRFVMDETKAATTDELADAEQLCRRFANIIPSTRPAATLMAEAFYHRALISRANDWARDCDYNF